MKPIGKQKNFVCGDEPFPHNTRRSGITEGGGLSKSVRDVLARLEKAGQLHTKDLNSKDRTALHKLWGLRLADRLANHAGGGFTFRIRSVE